LRACATITSCPSWVNCRLNQGECVPVSSAMRLHGVLPKTCWIPFGVSVGCVPESRYLPHPRCSRHSANLSHSRSPFHCA
jgi:hypothetical protein